MRSALSHFLFFASVFALPSQWIVWARSAEPAALPHLPGYEAVPLHYGAMNRMVVTLMVNGHKADFMVDTGAALSVLGAGYASAFGVKPVDANSQFGDRISMNGRSLQVGYIDNLAGGSMNFGGGPIALLGTYGVDRASARYHPNEFAGILGADILQRYKAIINCRTKTIFFKVSKEGHMQLARFAASQHFTRVPMREEVTRNLTVPASLGKRSLRLIVDTGEPLTEVDERILRAAGISLKPTHVVGSFMNTAPSMMKLALISDLKIGNFPIEKQMLTSSLLPDALMEQGKNHADGTLGIDTLALYRAIIDFDSMNLFLK